MTAPLTARVEEWFSRVLEYVRADETRAERTGWAGPARVVHTFEPGSSHAPLLDALLPAPAWADLPHDAAGQDPATVRVHSLQAPPPELMLPSPVTGADLGGRPAPRALEGTRWRLTWDAGAGVVRCFDRTIGEGVLVTAGPVEDWELGAPLRSFLHWHAAAAGGALVHAGTIGTSDGMGIVLGRGGTGKSTTVLVGLDAGLRTCGDDYVWLQPGPTGTTVYALYGTVKTKPDSPWRPPSGVRGLVVEDGAKTIHWLAASAPEQFVASAPLTAVVVLAAPGDTAAAAGALAAASASTAFQLPYDSRSTLGVLTSSLAGLPRVVVPRVGDLDLVRRELRAQLGTDPATEVAAHG